MIQFTSRTDVLEKVGHCLGLPVATVVDIDTAEAIAASLRRVATFACPCSGASLRALLVEALMGLSQFSGDELTSVIEGAIEELCAVGDLLELTQVTSLEEGTKSTWLFCAPPSFVVLDNGSLIFLMGMASDDPTPLPGTLIARVELTGARRLIKGTPNERLGQTLSDLGWRELSIQNWLRIPRADSAARHLEAMNAKLASAVSTDAIADLRILARQSPRQRYKDLWRPAADASGRFVCRRPQQFGADLWGYVELTNGAPQRLLTFPLKNSHDRGCDTAWRLQLAMDAVNGSPQTYTVTKSEEGWDFRFFFPVPLWAQRRLAVCSTPLTGRGSLFAYRVAPESGAELDRFLQKEIWLSLEA